MAYTAQQLTDAIERAKAAKNDAAVAELSAALATMQRAMPKPQAPASMSEQAGSFQPPASAFSAARPDVAGAQFQPPEGLRQFLYSSLETVPPAITAMRTAASATPQGLAANVLATGLTAGLAQLSSIGLRGGDVTSPESLGKAARSSVEFGVPGPILGGRAVFGLQGGISKGVQGSILTAGSILSGREAESFITGKPSRTFEGMSDEKLLNKEQLFKEVAIPSLVSGSLMSLGQAGGRMYDLAREALARRAFLRDLGVRNPTLAALLPSRFGDIEAAMASSSSSIQQGRQEMVSDAADSLRTRFNLNNYASNETVANRINPQIDRIAAADQAYQAANQVYEQANARLAAAQADTQLTGPQRAQVLQDAQEQVYRAIQERANALLTAGRAAPLEAGAQAARVSSTLQDLLGLRRRRAQELYAPLRSLGAVFTVDEIEEAAARGMSASFARSEEGQQILAGIRNYRGDGVTVAPSRVNPEARFDPTAPQVLPEEVRFDLEAVRQMREHLSDVVDGMQGGVVRTNEREASRAYNAINEAIRNRLQQVGSNNGANPAAGNALATQWDDARGYWASSFRAMETDDKALRMIVKGRATPEDLAGVADRLINKADATTIKALSDFTDVISGYDTTQRNLALSQIGSSIANSLIWKNTTSYQTNWNGIFDDVLRLSQARGITEVFPIEQLGLGTVREISENRALVRDFARRGLTNEAIGEAMASPLFTRAVESGMPTPRALNRSLAEAEFRQRVIQAEGLMAAGLTREAQEQFRQAETARRTAQMDQATARQRIEELQLDPAYQVLTGQLPLSRAPEVTSGRIGDLLMRSDTDTARRWISHLQRTDPGAYSEITTNTLANFLQTYIRAGGEVNFHSLNQAFTARNTEFAKLRAILPAETMNRLNEMPYLVRTMDDAVNSRPISDSSLRRFSEIMGITSGALRGLERGAAPTSMFGFREFIRRTGDLVSNGSYHILAHQLLNPGQSLVPVAGEISDVISRMPTQQAVILLNNTKLASDIAKEDARKKAKQGQPTR